MACAVQGIGASRRPPRPDTRSLEVCLEKTLFHSQPECTSARYRRAARADAEHQPQPAQHHHAGEHRRYSATLLHEYGYGHHHILDCSHGFVVAYVTGNRRQRTDAANPHHYGKSLAASATPYAGSLSVFSSDSVQFHSVPVNVSVSSIGVNPSTLLFPYTAGGTNAPPAQSSTLTIPSGTTVNLTANTASGGNWLQAGLTGTPPTAVSVQINTSVAQSLAPAHTREPSPSRPPPAAVPSRQPCR